MKKGIIGILNNPATSENSHSAGMVHIIKELFEATILTHNDNWDDYDELILYHGVNFREGSFNVVGGITDEVIKRADMLFNFKKKILTLDKFQLNDFGKVRKFPKYENFPIIESISLPEKENLVIGDSHSISVWPDATYSISRNDGKTLFGFLSDKNKDWHNDLHKYKKLIFYFGNIDLRFHLGRQENPQQATKELFERYCKFVKQYKSSTITQLLPLEDESRILPKTGLYLGKTFFGDLSLRNELRNIANKIMEDSGIPLIKWPEYFIDTNNKLKLDIMEPRQSVHIRPKFYKRNEKIEKTTKLF